MKTSGLKRCCELGERVLRRPEQDVDPASPLDGRLALALLVGLDPLGCLGFPFDIRTKGAPYEVASALRHELDAVLVVDRTRHAGVCPHHGNPMAELVLDQDHRPVLNIVLPLAHHTSRRTMQVMVV